MVFQLENLIFQVSIIVDTEDSLCIVFALGCGVGDIGIEYLVQVIKSNNLVKLDLGREYYRQIQNCH